MRDSKEWKLELEEKMPKGAEVKVIICGKQMIIKKYKGVIL